MEEDRTLQHPQCCPRVVCQDDNAVHGGSDYDYEDDGVEVWSGSNAVTIYY